MGPCFFKKNLFSIWLIVRQFFVYPVDALIGYRYLHVLQQNKNPVIACTYIDHGAYLQGSTSTLLYVKSGTIESCKAECSADPSCNGFGRKSETCYFSSTIVPFSTSCSSCSYFTKDNCGKLNCLLVFYCKSFFRIPQCLLAHLS